MFKKMTILLTTIMIYAQLAAPSSNSGVIFEAERVCPYEEIWQAVCKVESNYNPFAIGDKHLKEYSYGIAQLRRVRIEDFNRRTGSNYTINDAFSPEISKRIFFFYASEIGPYDMARIAKSWNGSGKMTIEYWKKIKKVL